jgi:hypothetical protein
MSNLKLKISDAKNVSAPHKTRPFLEESTPRWSEKLLDSVGLENGSYQINKVSKEGCDMHFDVSEYGQIPESNIDFDDKPETVELYAVETLIKIPAMINDIYNVPHDQKSIQFDLALEKILERKEKLLFYFGNTSDQYDENDERKKRYGLYNYCKNNDRVMTVEKQQFQLDMLDKMLQHVWIKPTFFILHPVMLNKILTLCTQNSIYPEKSELFGYNFVTWRGIPLVPCDKLHRKDKNIYDIFLIRTGEKDNGVVQLFNNNISHGQTASLVVKENSADDRRLISYRVSYYFNVAVLSQHAIYLCEYSE